MPATSRAADNTPAPATSGAREAALYDPATGRFLLSRSATTRTAVGSLVKLMTARLAMGSGDLGRLVTVPATVTRLPETKAGLIPGQRIPLNTLLQALLVRSANDAALSIATGLAGGEPAFAVRMNAEAAHLGLTQTHYVDSSGLDAPGQWSSAHDVAVLAAANLELPGFAAIVDRPSVAMPGGRVYRTVNPFLAFYPGATGVKTGFTSDARFCLAASADRRGRTLIAVVLGEPSWTSADGDAAALLNWGFGSAPGSAAIPSVATSETLALARAVPATRRPAVGPSAPAAPAAVVPPAAPTPPASHTLADASAKRIPWWTPLAAGAVLAIWGIRRRIWVRKHPPVRRARR